MNRCCATCAHHRELNRERDWQWYRLYDKLDGCACEKLQKELAFGIDDSGSYVEDVYVPKGWKCSWYEV